MEQRQTSRAGTSIVAALLSLLATPAKTETLHGAPAPQPAPVTAQAAAAQAAAAQSAAARAVAAQSAAAQATAAQSVAAQAAIAKPGAAKPVGAVVAAGTVSAAMAGHAGAAAPASLHARARHAAAGLSIAAVAPLEPQEASPSFILANKPPAAPASGFQPAPLPNPDAAAPRGAPAAGARLAPAFLTRKEEFLGNGFARASSPDYAAYEKRNPAAGLSLSVPVVQ